MILVCPAALLRNKILLKHHFSSFYILCSEHTQFWGQDLVICFSSDSLAFISWKDLSTYAEDEIWEKHWLSFIYILNFIYLFFIQQVLSSYLSYTHQFIHVNPNRPIHHTTIPTTPWFSPPWCPYVCSLHLCLNFCPANRFIIFLGSTYMR